MTAKSARKAETYRARRRNDFWMRPRKSREDVSPPRSAWRGWLLKPYPEKRGYTSPVGKIYDRVKMGLQEAKRRATRQPHVPKIMRRGVQ